MKTTYLISCLFFLATACLTQAGETINLIDKNLSNFEIWMGIPHKTVQGLPAGTHQSYNVMGGGPPMGLNADIKKVFSVIQENGEPVLRISGEIYGGLTTKASYGNYHFSTQFKWGDKKWEPRLDKKLDSGILYHCYGAHGRFWNVWKTSIEYQVMENDLGDFISLRENIVKPGEKGPSAKVRRTIPESEASALDNPQGEWNTLEIYAVGDDAIHLVNDKVVQTVRDIRLHDETPLVNGQIQIQSEGAECYYKNMLLTPIKDFPPEMIGMLN